MSDKEQINQMIVFSLEGFDGFADLLSSWGEGRVFRFTLFDGSSFSGEIEGSLERNAIISLWEDDSPNDKILCVPFDNIQMVYYY